MSEEDTQVAQDKTPQQGQGTAEKKKHHPAQKGGHAASPTTAPPQEGPAGGSVDGKQQRAATGKKAPAGKAGSTKS